MKYIIIVALYHGATGECIEHVKEDEASEGHCGVPRGDHLVLHLKYRTAYLLHYMYSYKIKSDCLGCAVLLCLV